MKSKAVSALLLIAAFAAFGCQTEGKRTSSTADGPKTQMPGAAPRGSQEERSNTTLSTLEVVDAHTAFAFGTNDEGFTGSVVLKTSDDGAHWNCVLRTAQTELVAIDFVDAQNGVAISDGGTAYTTKDGGTTWTGSNEIELFRSAFNLPADATAGASAPYQSLNGVFVRGKLGWAVGGREERRPGAKPGRIDSVTRPLVVRTVDGGATWKMDPSAPDLPAVELKRTYFVDDKNGWAVGGEVDDEPSWAVLRTTDGGVSWKKITPNEKQSPEDVFFLDATNGWLVGSTEDDAGDPGPSEVLVTHDGGATFERQAKLAASLRAIRFADAQNGWAVGTEGRTYHSTDGGATWIEQTAHDWTGGQVIETTDPLYPNGKSQPTFTGFTLVAPGKGWASSDLGVYEYTAK